MILRLCLMGWGGVGGRVPVYWMTRGVGEGRRAGTRIESGGGERVGWVGEGSNGAEILRREGGSEEGWGSTEKATP